MGSFINRLRLRTNMVQETAVAITIAPTAWLRTGSLGVLPNSPDGTNFGLVMENRGTNGDLLKSSDFEQTTITEKARTLFVLPECYVPGGAIIFRIRGRIFAAANVSATIDLTAYNNAGDGSVSADLCATAAQAIGTSYADYDFTITPAGLVVGDELNLEVVAALNDTGGSATLKRYQITSTKMLLTLKG